jgi:predicted RNA-binding protein with PIN domain
VDPQRLIVVDGYNLILRSPALRPEGGRTLRESRERLINLLSWTVGAGEARFLVVFDGEEGGRESGGGRVEVRYARKPQTADDVIRRVVEEAIDRGQALTVVTSDLEVARHARTMGADIALGDLFLSSVLSPPKAGAPEKPESLSRRELEEWAELFRQRRVEPADE